MDIVKLKPACKDYIWGGTKLISWGKEASGNSIAEAWELSLNDNGPSLIDSGLDKGKALKDVMSKEDLGSKSDRFPFFPILIKLIDAKSNLSIQVHPSDEYALKYENSFGKTEMWYVLEADKDACLYVGFKQDISKEEVEERIKNNTIVEVLNKINVKPGECYFIASGTIHAIGAGCTIIEIQQNSNLTYRVYDYGRVGADGKPRELHIEKALKVLNLKAYKPVDVGNNLLLSKCEYFTTYQSKGDEKEIAAPKDSFASVTFVEGSGVFADMSFKKGDTFFIPAGKKAPVSGKFKFIYSTIE